MIDLVNLSLQFGGTYLYKEVNFKINPGDKISLVGANGTGKTSLLRLINGEVEPESGDIFRKRNISVGYLPQENVVHSGRTLIDEASTALASIIELRDKEEALTELLQNPELTEEEILHITERLGEVHADLEASESYSAESKVEKVLMGLGFEEKDFNRMTDEFSGGWQMRIALAKILLSENDVLLMDEPTNHLDLDSLEWVTNFLINFKGALLLVSHDRSFVNKVTNKTLEIFLKKFTVFNGNYDHYLKYKAERDAQIEKDYEMQQKKVQETQKFIERFRYKATKAKQVQSRIKALEKVELLELPDFENKIKFRFPQAPSSGRILMEMKKVSKSFGSLEVLKNIDLILERGDKIAFVGPNGAGKSTLAKLIAGVHSPTSGVKIPGHNLVVAYFAQDVANELNPSAEILDVILELSGDMSIPQVRSLLGSFLFNGDDVFKKISVLSGGEKGRVALASILLKKANLLVLDEPTNHLDFASKQVLQNALLAFEGSLIIVSHDIDFLRPIVNKVVDIRKGQFRIFPGDIDYYLSKRVDFLDKGSAPPVEKERSQANQDKKKDKKRLEAELRQKKYAESKFLIQRLEEIEKSIATLEKLEKSLENELTQEHIYSKPALMKEKTIFYNETKNELEKVLAEWEQISLKISEIENKYQLN